MTRIWLVTRRELIAGATKKAFVIATAIMFSIIIIGAVVIAYFEGREDEDAGRFDVGVTASLTEMIPSLVTSGQSLGITVETSEVPDRPAAEAAFEDGTLDAFVSGEPGAVDLLYPSNPVGPVTQAVAAASQTLTLSERISALGGDPAEVARDVQASVPTISYVEDTGAMEGPEYVVAMISAALLFFALVNSGSQIAIGVVEEKSSRVVEILLATLRPTELFAGKVLGNGLLGLGQVLLYGVAALGSIAALDLLEGVQVNLGSQILWLLLWFVLGFSLYAVLWGSLASLVSRQEDIGSITAPVTILMLVPFYTAVFMVPVNPDGDITRILSMAPFFAPFMMPFRTAFTEVPAWQLGVAVALSAASIPLFVWLAATVYKRGVLHTGSRLTLRQALRRS